MYRHPCSVLLSSALVCSFLVMGCGDGKPQATKSKIAAAFENQVDPDANAREAGEGMRKLKERAAAEAAVLAEIDKITVPASDAPTDIKKACAGMGAAHDGFVQKRLASDRVELDRWNVMKAVDLEKIVETCVAEGQPKVAACQQHALANASPEIGRHRVETLATTCTRKYGQPLASAPGKPAKSAG